MQKRNKQCPSDRPVRNSLSRTYTLGYLLLLAILVMFFLITFWTNKIQMDSYEQAVGELLDINNLFVNVDQTNRSVYADYMYLHKDSEAKYRQDSKTTRAALEHMFQRLDREYSREVMDLCCMVETFLNESDGLLSELSEFRKQTGNSDSSGLSTTFLEIQELISYINQSFQEVYTLKLATTQQMQIQIQQMQRITSILYAAMLLLALVICLTYYRRVVKNLTCSVNQLTDFADKVTQEPTLQQHVRIDTGDELAVFADAFNGMIDTIQKQMKQIEEDSRVRQQLQEAEMENLRISAVLQSSQLKLLQSRINPHFLFNTLNMITQTAHMEDAEETAQLMEATAELLRYNLDKVTKSVTLADELWNTHNYIYIQHCRFGDRIQFDFETDESCLGQGIPCMILQPLVENAITHGVGSLIDGGRVTIRLFSKENYAWLEVEDNGVGIPEEKLSMLRSSFDTMEVGGEHIGLRNVYQRLKIFFGSELQFHLESEPGHTVVRIGLPQGREETA